MQAPAAVPNGRHVPEVIISADTANPDAAPHFYETSFTVDRSIEAEFVAYLREHMADIMQLQDGALFDRAKLCFVIKEDIDEPDKTYICAQYRARSRWKLQEYFEKYGEQLRNDMLAKFPNKFSVERRILAVNYLLEHSNAAPGEY